MRATRLNHVSVRADDLEESAEFYESVFGMHRLPTPRFAAPLIWMRLGDLQIHLFQRDTVPPQFEHFALEVDDFEAIYRRTEELGAHDRGTHGHHLLQLADGGVQLYLRDPAGNLVEIVTRSAAELSPELRAELINRMDKYPQTEEQRSATLFLLPPDG
jgi:lactoylglutathione lyase